MLIDTHSHLNVAAFNKDRKDVVKRCLDNDIFTINVGTNFETSKKAVQLTAEYNKGLYAAIGLHPINLDTGLVKRYFDEQEGGSYEKEFDYKGYKTLGQSKNVVAIGEIGLDYYWKPKTTKKKELFKQMQKNLLKEQLSLAKDLSLPVIFHCRVAHRDLLDFLKGNPDLMPEKCVAHGFVGTKLELNEYLSMGFYVGINGIIFKDIQGLDLIANVRAIPFDRLLLETDCPYLTPPQANVDRNEPLFMKYTAQKVADIRGVDVGKIYMYSTKNATEVFGISIQF